MTVRLRVNLIDSERILVANSADKILYASNSACSVKDICADLLIKLELDSEEFSLQLWSDEYLVPDWTSVDVFQRDEVVQLRILPMAKRKRSLKRSGSASVTVSRTNSSLSSAPDQPNVLAKKSKLSQDRPPEVPQVERPKVSEKRPIVSRQNSRLVNTGGHKYFGSDEEETTCRTPAECPEVSQIIPEVSATVTTTKALRIPQINLSVGKSDFNPFQLSKSHSTTTCAQLPGQNRKSGQPPTIFYRNKPTGVAPTAQTISTATEAVGEKGQDQWHNRSVLIQNEEQSEEENVLEPTCDEANVAVVDRQILHRKSVVKAKPLLICRHPDNYVTLRQFVLQNGDLFSYKTLELGPNFCPQVSGWKFVKISENESNTEGSFTALPLYCVTAAGGKYELFEPAETSELVELRWNGLFDPKLIQD